MPDVAWERESCWDMSERGLMRIPVQMCLTAICMRWELNAITFA